MSVFCFLTFPSLFVNIIFNYSDMVKTILQLDVYYIRNYVQSRSILSSHHQISRGKYHIFPNNSFDLPQLKIKYTKVQSTKIS